jgi:hypothetical protein
MSELDERQAGIDDLLRRSMSAPVPRLSEGFPKRLSRELRLRSRPPHPFGRILLKAYVVVSVATSILVMRGQGLSFGAIAVTTLGPLALLEVSRRLQHGA